MVLVMGMVVAMVVTWWRHDGTDLEHDDQCTRDEEESEGDGDEQAERDEERAEGKAVRIRGGSEVVCLEQSWFWGGWWVVVLVLVSGIVTKGQDGLQWWVGLWGWARGIDRV